MRNGIHAGAVILGLVTGVGAARADEPAPRVAVSGGFDLGGQARSHAKFSPHDEGTSDSPPMVELGAHVNVDWRLTGALSLAATLRAATFFDTPLQDEVRVSGSSLAAEVGVACDFGPLRLRLATGPTYVDTSWTWIGGDPDHSGAVSGWGVVVDAEAAMALGKLWELGPGFSISYVDGVPFDELHLSLTRRF